MLQWKARFSVLFASLGLLAAAAGFLSPIGWNWA